MIEVPRTLYTKDLQRMFEFLRYKKVTKTSKASPKQVNALVELVQKKRNEKKQGLGYL